MLKPKTRKYFDITLIAVAALGIGVGAYWVARFGIIKVRAQQAVQARPFLAERWLISYKEIPSGKIEEKRLIGQRSDGAAYEKLLAVFHGPGQTPTRKLTLPDGRIVVINDQERVRTTKRMRDVELAQFKGEIAKAASTTRRCGQPHWVFAGEEMVIGRKTQIWQYESMSDDRQTVFRRTSYLAPDFGCVPLKIVEEQRGLSQPYTKIWENVTQWMTDNEPQASETDSADSYKELPPSNFWRRSDRATALVMDAIEKDYCKNNPCSDQQRRVMQTTADSLRADDKRHASQIR